MRAAQDEIMKIAVVGGGASGVFAALVAAHTAKKNRKNVQIRIYESNSRLLKTILVTGNGRCNLSNAEISAAHYFGAVDLFSSVYACFDRPAALSFFESLGLLTVTDSAGRIYPMSMKASSVVDILLRGLEKNGIEIVADTRITSMKKEKHGYLLNDAFYADKVIFAAGGKVGGSGNPSAAVYDLLKAFGVKCTYLQPALTAFMISDFTKSLKGIRTAGALTLSSERSEIAKMSGEIQYTEYGISGIPAMQLSSFAARANAKQLFLTADSLPEMKEEDFVRRIYSMKKSDPQMPMQLFLTGILPKPLGVFFLKESGASQECQLRHLTDALVSDLLKNCKHKRYAVKGLRGFENAQVTSGGIAGSEITERLELKKLPGVFVCGELIDVDGDCGGYNLQWAWSSGAVAGIHSVLEI